MKKKTLKFDYSKDHWIINESHPLYWYGYCFLGMYEGWIEFDKKYYELCQTILEVNGWLKWSEN